MFAHSFGTKRRMMSQGTAETYSSASTTSPPRISKCFTELSSLSTSRSTAAFMRTWPPSDSMWSTMGRQSRSGWLPSRKAICNPSVSFRNRFMAVNTTVMDKFSGSMKSKAFAIAMKTSSLILSGIPCRRMNSRTEMSSWASMNDWPSINIGNRGGAVCSFSGRVSIFWFIKIAKTKFSGAGIPWMKSNVVNSPGSSCIAKIIWWRFHCRRSSMPSSLNNRIMFG
mmetsp:Transcript_27786/g.80564  ORF Transcript_27786/g.80564 Transcript_27786/m.80564 type:complete len:225 (-) Transcript_27786:359-1033(-)